MTRNKKLNLISVLLALTAIAMIAVGIAMKIPAPAITGVGFLLIVWAFQVLKVSIRATTVLYFLENG